MRRARESLLIQQQYIHMHWGSKGESTRATPNLYLEEAIAAGRRGVSVRILLSDAFLTPSDEKDNLNTVTYVNEIAQKENLNMQARIIRSKLIGVDKIHNKGVVVDNRFTLVSSINWSRNSPVNNREVSLLIDNPQIGAYFDDIFTFDWYDGTPADYPLITEIDLVAGFVEITHHGDRTIEIGGWSLRNSTGVSLAIPANTQLTPGVPLVIARDGIALGQKHPGIKHLIEIPGLVPKANGDWLTLQRGSRAVDLVAWLDAYHGWELASPGSGPLCRPDSGKDTNTHLDWVSGRVPSPGIAGCAP